MGNQWGVPRVCEQGEPIDNAPPPTPQDNMCIFYILYIPY